MVGEISISKRSVAMTLQQERILVIDDDRELCSLLAEYLKPEGYSVEEANDGETGIEMAFGSDYSLLVLDVMLPGRLNGFDVLRKIRTRSMTPILMLSARGDDVDRIVGLEMGADDYLPKPFNPRELLARIRTILRRSREETQETRVPPGVIRYRVGDIELDSGARLAFRGEEPVELTSVEYQLLEVLLRHAGQVVHRDELALKVLDRPLSPYDRSIDVHVSKLRKKLGPDNNGAERIKAIRGSGYMYIVSSPVNRKIKDRSAEKENPDAEE